MSDPLLDAIAAVSDKSPQIKRALGLAAQRIIALEHPAPPPSTSRGGIGFQAFGHAAPPGAGRFDYVAVTEPEIPAALAQTPPARLTLVYMAAVDVNIHVNYGVDYATAAANGWLLKDAAGVPLRNVGYTDNYIGDVGSDGYRKAWFDNVAATLLLRQPQGVYVDDVLGDTQLLIGGGYPAKYPTRDAWQDAMAGFVQYVGDRLLALGWYVAVNASAFTPDDPNSNTPVNDTAWWKRLGPHVSGLVREYWQQSPGSVDTVFTSDAAKGWLGQWQAWQALPTLARSLGCDFWGLGYGSSTTLDYLRASFLLTWDGRGGGIVAGDSSLAWTTANLGAPLGAAAVTGSVWTRSFEHGKVTLDSLRGTATVAAG